MVLLHSRTLELLKIGNAKYRRKCARWYIEEKRTLIFEYAHYEYSSENADTKRGEVQKQDELY